MKINSRIHSQQANKELIPDLSAATTGINVEVCPICPSDCPDCVIALLAVRSKNNNEFQRKLNERKKSFNDIVILIPRNADNQNSNG